MRRTKISEDDMTRANGMGLLRWIVGLGFALALVACGGGGGERGSSAFGGGGGGGGGGAGTAPKAADLVVQTSSAQLSNTASSTVTITVTAVDGSGVVVADAPVQMSADNGGVLTKSAATTDSTGKVTGELSIGGDRSNRLITVTAASGSISKTVAVQVVGTKVTSTLVPAVVAPSAAAQVQYRVVDQTGNPMVGQAISIAAAGLNPASATGTTDNNGAYVFNYSAPATTGSFAIVASVGGVTDTQTVNVQSASTVAPAALPITSASVSANPSVVSVNTAASKANRSEIRALFLAAGNVPVPNVRVKFDLAGDANAVGGSFSTGDSILYADANGVVTTAYVPGTRSSPTNGVTVRACYGTTDNDPNLLNCTTSARVTLTVVSEPLGVSIGTNALIVVNSLTYTKQFVVTVADAAGNAKADVQLSASVDLPQYRKGQYAAGAKAWAKSGPLPSGDMALCINEDRNRNGVLEANEDDPTIGGYPTVGGNGNGRLDPGRSDVTVRLLSDKTDANGQAIVELTYAQSFGSWVDAVLTVAASGVAGTEGRASFVLAPVPVDAAAINNIAAPPAFATSPYGLSNSCRNPN
ncbi:MAG: Ig-like domain-containing protein [Proteobacteria bacterium]|nr:Ig-like domain-containing protein [Pseudomonadota bacterium]